MTAPAGVRSQAPELGTDEGSPRRDGEREHDQGCLRRSVQPSVTASARSSEREYIGQLNQSCDKERHGQSSEEVYEMRSGFSQGYLYHCSLVPPIARLSP